MDLSKNIKVLIGPSSFAAIDKEPLNRLIDFGCEVIDNPYKRKLTKDELIESLSDDVTALIAGLETIDREVLKHSALKIVSRCGSGMSNVDIAAAKEYNIKVFFSPDGPTDAVAELTLGAILSSLRMITQMDHDLHKKNWNKKIGAQLSGKTVTIIGYGRIGRRLADLLSPFKVKILVVDPFIQKTETNTVLVKLNEALPQSDIISIHSSGDDQVIGEEEFKIIKKGAYLCNAARGGLIDEVSLIDALEQGIIAGAWIDTFINEPYKGRLTQYPHVILTPHVGSYTAECRKKMETEAVDNLISALKGKTRSKNEV